MSGRERSPQRPRRRPVLPPLSSRTLQHPSIMSLCVAADSPRSHADTVHPIIPEEFFYTDPTLERGRRVPNIMSWFRVFDCSQLNTPVPIMSARPAPPIRPDPFGPDPLPTRDLGSLTWRVAAPRGRPGRLVLQLTPDEDEAVTNLLKLHHHRAPPRRSLSELEAARTLVSRFDPGGRGPGGRLISETEGEAVHVLLSLADVA